MCVYACVCVCMLYVCCVCCLVFDVQDSFSAKRPLMVISDAFRYVFKIHVICFVVRVT